MLYTGCLIKNGQKFKGDSTHSNKQLSSKNTWSELKRKGADAFRNMLPVNIKAPFYCEFLEELR